MKLQVTTNNVRSTCDRYNNNRPIRNAKDESDSWLFVCVEKLLANWKLKQLARLSIKASKKELFIIIHYLQQDGAYKVFIERECSSKLNSSGASKLLKQRFLKIYFLYNYSTKLKHFWLSKCVSTDAHLNHIYHIIGPLYLYAFLNSAALCGVIGLSNVRPQGTKA